MLSTILKHPVSMKTLSTDVRSICEITQKYLRQDKNIFPMILTVRTFLTKNTRLSDGLVSARLFKPRKSSQNLLVRHRQTKLDIDTNVKNNVILYKNENHRYIRIMHIVASLQLFGWSLLAIYTYKPSFFDIFYTDIKLKEHINNHIFRLTFFIFSLIIGPLAYATIYIVCSHTIRYIVLHKGGKNVTFITCNLWNKENIQIPTAMVRCIHERTSDVTIIPLKLKDRRFYYMVDKSGTFSNPQLFDHTIGFSHFRNL